MCTTIPFICALVSIMYICITNYENSKTNLIYGILVALVVHEISMVERFSILYGNLIEWEFKLTYFINTSLLVFFVAYVGNI